MHTYSKKQHSTNTVFKKKRKEQNYVCTKDVSEIREKKNEKSNNMAYPKKEERISKLVFPFRFKSKDK